MIITNVADMEFRAREEDLQQVAKEILAKYTSSLVFALEGTLGAGKTALIKAFCQVLEVMDVVASPTFSIVNEYHTRSEAVVYHFDFYRIDQISEAVDIGYFEYIESGSYCFIEWPEKIRELLPVDLVYITLEETGVQGERMIRTIKISSDHPQNI